MNSFFNQSFYSSKPSTPQKKGSSYYPYKDFRVRDENTYQYYTLKNISCMPEYKTQSIEEIRYEDYEIGRKPNVCVNYGTNVLNAIPLRKDFGFGQSSFLSNTNNFSGFPSSLNSNPPMNLGFGSSVNPSAPSSFFGTTNNSNSLVPSSSNPPNSFLGLNNNAFGSSSLTNQNLSSQNSNNLSNIFGKPSTGFGTQNSSTPFGSQSLLNSNTPGFGAVSNNIFGSQPANPLSNLNNTPFNTQLTSNQTNLPFGQSQQPTNPLSNQNNLPFGHTQSNNPFGSGQSSSNFLSTLNQNNTNSNTQPSKPPFNLFGSNTNTNTVNNSLSQPQSFMTGLQSNSNNPQPSNFLSTISSQPQTTNQISSTGLSNNNSGFNSLGGNTQVTNPFTTSLQQSNNNNNNNLLGSNTLTQQQPLLPQNTSTSMFNTNTSSFLPFGNVDKPSNSLSNTNNLFNTNSQQQQQTNSNTNTNNLGSNMMNFNNTNMSTQQTNQPNQFQTFSNMNNNISNQIQSQNQNQMQMQNQPFTSQQTQLTSDPYLITGIKFDKLEKPKKNIKEFVPSFLSEDTKKEKNLNFNFNLNTNIKQENRVPIKLHSKYTEKDTTINLNSNSNKKVEFSIPLKDTKKMEKIKNLKIKLSRDIEIMYLEDINVKDMKESVNKFSTFKPFVKVNDIIGSGMNKKARVIVKNFWPVGKSCGVVKKKNDFLGMSEIENGVKERFLYEISRDKERKFVSYDWDKGIYVYDVNGFK